MEIKLSEHEEQALIFQWAELAKCMYPGLELLHAIPNGAKLPWKRDKRGKRFSPEAIRLKGEGLKSGVPDMFLPVPRAGFHGLYIELKSEGGRLSKEQMWWIEKLTKQGYYAVACWGHEQAQEMLVSYLSMDLTT